MDEEGRRRLAGLLKEIGVLGAGGRGSRAAE
jgi:hypothetical protein